MQASDAIIRLKRRIPGRVKLPFSRLKQGFMPYRHATSANRVLPDFLIIGAMKSGTSSLFAYLQQHPQLIPSCKKEVHYFDGGGNPDVDKYAKGEAWYRAHFPLRGKLGSGSITFEATPIYIFNPLVPKRVSELVPDVKIIAVLRNPTERAISHYFHAKRIKKETLPIYEALVQEEKRLQPVIERKDYRNWMMVHYSYKKRGLYEEQLRRYLEYFPRKQMLIVSSEDLFGDLHGTLERIFDFVGADTDFRIDDIRARNIGYNRVECDARVYDYLDNYFLPHNQALYELVGEDFGW
jgi:hypothetical protein